MAKGENTDIEFVDELNTTSLIAESSAMKYLDEKGGLDLRKKINISSSGIIVGDIRSRDARKLSRGLRPYLDILFEKRIISAEEKERLNKTKDIDLLAKIANHLVNSYDEVTSLMLKDKNLEYRVNKQRLLRPEKTKVRKNAGLILTMSQESGARTKIIYSTTKFNPTIELLTDDLERLKKIIGFFGSKSIEISDYNEIRELTREITKKALDKFL